MKKMIFLLALTLGLSAASFANNDETISAKAQQAFKKEFVQAREVKWEKSGELAKATFTYNDRVLFAYYSQDGDLLALTRNLTSDQLPLSLLNAFKKDWSEYWITDLFEMVTNGQTTYYLGVENADQKVVLKSEAFTDWTVFKKDKKEVI